MTLGERIAQTLREREMSQHELAEMVGVTDISMTRYIRNERMPNAQVVLNMARALRVTTDYLLGMEDR